MSSLGVRRKVRVIQTLDDDEPTGAQDNNNNGQDSEFAFSMTSRPASSILLIRTRRVANVRRVCPDSPQVQVPVKFTRKPNKSSSLRKSINVADIDHDMDAGGGGAPVSNAAAAAAEDDDDAGMPVVVRPSISRAGSTKQKKKPASSRLSFGPEAASTDDDVSTPQKPLSQRAAENAALKKKKPINLPARLLGGGDDDRPRYSKEYLSELQSSTPNTPHDLSTLTLDDDGDEQQLALAMEIDPSELEGATVVLPTTAENTSASTALTSRAPVATILTAGQIQEKKERRARLALQGGGGGEGGDYIALSDDDDGDERLPSKKKDSRLIAEDEDLGEGYDEFVEDGGISLGRAAERKARARRKKEMAELIASAEAPEDDDDGDNSDDSLDRRAEYEAAQRRKGMGVEVLGDGEEDGSAGGDVIPKMKALPDLKECLQRMNDLVSGLENEVRQKKMRIAALQKEREEIVSREGDVQEVLNQAGQKYQAVLGSRPGAEAAKLAAQSPLRNASVPLPPGLAVPGLAPVERGLESFGTTPTARPEDEEML
ncbi:nineteen complex-related protein 2-domain-containing protein [Coniochaeta sp. 2T2.1]|nr:nineteen complex-related protein 2-domain-containing protein [Coniochaeta sp. 2T2.1]